MQWNDSYAENVFTFANNINTIEGGTHLIGFRSALTRSINNYAISSGQLKKDDENLQGDDVREGLTAVISVKVPEPQFEGQTKTKLGNSEVKGIVEALVNEKLGNYLSEHPADAKKIVAKGVEAARVREATRKADSECVWPTRVEMPRDVAPLRRTQALARVLTLKALAHAREHACLHGL